jgi:hypothetical protein
VPVSPDERQYLVTCDARAACEPTMHLKRINVIAAPGYAVLA